MPGSHHVVVDGSNLATEGRTVPSLAQLDAAVRAYLAEDPEAEVVVVVDASFSHRIDPAEQAQLEAAELHGELVAPPAGAIGRGDAFVLRIAERTGATVLSNDSFQEFHEEHPWLFDEGRLVGGKPVPGVGWIFTPRRPVRGPRSRKARDGDDEGPEDQLSAARKAAEVAKALKKATKGATGARAKVDKASSARGGKKKAAKSADGIKGATAKAAKGGRAKQGKEPAVAAGPAKKAGAKKAAAKKTAVKGAASAKAAPKAKVKEKPAAKGLKEPKKVSRPAKGASQPAKKAAKRAAKTAGPLGFRAAIDRATKEVLAPVRVAGARSGAATKPKRRRRVEPPPAVNEPLAFIDFVATHPVGSVVEGVVASFTSHGAMVDVALDDSTVLHCYAPLIGLGSPPPRAAREVLRRGKRREFALVGLDPPRRMAELALPEFASAQHSVRSEGPQAAG